MMNAESELLAGATSVVGSFLPSLAVARTCDDGTRLRRHRTGKFIILMQKKRNLRAIDKWVSEGRILYYFDQLFTGL